MMNRKALHRMTNSMMKMMGRLADREIAFETTSPFLQLRNSKLHISASYIVYYLCMARFTSVIAHFVSAVCYLALERSLFCPLRT